MCNVTLKITVGAYAQRLENVVRNIDIHFRLLQLAISSTSPSAIMAVFTPVDRLLSYGLDL